MPESTLTSEAKLRECLAHMRPSIERVRISLRSGVPRAEVWSSLAVRLTAEMIEKVFAKLTDDEIMTLVPAEDVAAVVVGFTAPFAALVVSVAELGVLNGSESADHPLIPLGAFDGNLRDIHIATHRTADGEEDFLGVAVTLMAAARLCDEHLSRVEPGQVVNSLDIAFNDDASAASVTVSGHTYTVSKVQKGARRE